MPLDAENAQRATDPGLWKAAGSFVAGMGLAFMTWVRHARSRDVEFRESIRADGDATRKVLRDEGALTRETIERAFDRIDRRT